MPAAGQPLTAARLLVVCYAGDGRVPLVGALLYRGRDKPCPYKTRHECSCRVPQKCSRERSPELFRGGAFLLPGPVPRFFLSARRTRRR